MGADGHIIIVELDKFKEANPHVDPKELGAVYVGEFLGKECVWSYSDTSHGDNYLTRYAVSDNDFGWGYVPYDFKDKTDVEKELILRASDWFEENAEFHEVWT